MTSKMNEADLDLVRGGVELTRLAPNTSQGSANIWKPADDEQESDAKQS